MNAGSKNLVALGLLMANAFAFWFWVIPNYTILSSLRAMLEERQILLARQNDLLQKIVGLGEGYKEKLNDLRKIGLMVPEKDNIAEIITAMEDVALKSGVNLGELGLSVEKGLQSSTKKTTASAYNTVTLDISLKGGYLAMLNYLDSLEKNVRILDLDKLEAAPDSTGSSGNNPVLNFSIKGKSYFLKNANDLAKEKGSNARTTGD